MCISTSDVQKKTFIPFCASVVITICLSLFSRVFDSIKVVPKFVCIKRSLINCHYMALGFSTLICFGVIVWASDSPRLEKLVFFTNSMQFYGKEESVQRNATSQTESFSKLLFKSTEKPAELVKKGDMHLSGEEIMPQETSPSTALNWKECNKYSDCFDLIHLDITQFYHFNASETKAGKYRNYFNQRMNRTSGIKSTFFQKLGKKGNSFSPDFQRIKSFHREERRRNIYLNSSRQFENIQCTKNRNKVSVSVNYVNEDSKISRNNFNNAKYSNFGRSKNNSGPTNDKLRRDRLPNEKRDVKEYANSDKVDGKKINHFSEKKEFSRHFKADLFQSDYHDYCIVGAGPAGLQMAYFMKQSGRDYIIYEKNNISGSFFEVFPRHRKLISINKRFTGKSNKEFQLRHDWNSLLSDDKKLSFKYFSKEYFPHADSMVSYLNEFKNKLDLRVRYNSEIRNIRRTLMENNDIPIFLMNDPDNNVLACRYVIVSTGMGEPNAPFFEGSDLVTGYEDLDLNFKEFEGKTVLILGRGNSAFETANSLYEHTNMVHMVSRSRARLAWNTHYVGDLRAINNALLDSYQLKSLDGLLEASVEEMILQKRGRKLYVKFPYEETKISSPEAEQTPVNDDQLTANDKNKEIDNFSLREGYDHVIRCLGFKFDFSPFHNSTKIFPSKSVRKYPSIKRTFESKTVPDLYFAGTITHSLDFRKSSGGFIHGFRYTIQALHRLLEWKNHGKKWPLKSFSSHDLHNILIKRMNEASGPYQMFGVLGDIFIFKEKGHTFDLIEEFPISLLHQVENLTGHEVTSSILVLMMDYGPDFSGPDKDTLRPDRATGDPLDAHRSNFLHPVLYYYDHLPTDSEMLIKFNQLSLPKPKKLHHVLEDFLTSWTTRRSHILPLRRFLETVLNMDLRNQLARSCLKISITNLKFPFRCLRSKIL